MNPKFSIGEEVILWPAITRLQGKRTTIINESIGCYNTEYGWFEPKHLRKIPKGNGKTLNEFMEELKGVTVTV